MKNRLEPMSRAEWWATFIGLAIRDAVLTVCAALMSLRYIPDRTLAVNAAVLIVAVMFALWACLVTSIARSHRRGRRGGVS